jgi:hypothetical protein
MSPSAPLSPLRQILETSISHLSVEMEVLFAEARERGRRESADQLNQAVRRLRQAPDVDELGSMLVDAAVAFCTGAALLSIRDDGARGEWIRGVSSETERVFRGLEFPLAAGAALAGAVESRDPVIAASTPGQVSTAMFKLAGHQPEGRVSIYPLVIRDAVRDTVREEVPALLYTWGKAEGSALELLSQVAAAAWQELSAPISLPAHAEPAADLIQIAPPAVAAAVEDNAAVPARESAWDRLSPLEQQLHFRAQRFARVQVAEFRLQHADVVQASRAQRSLYEALQTQIDAARETFRQTFFSPCASMVDYLHLELVRTLAHDDPELLGKHYPGPIV